jgi:hypothetical protein
MVNKEPDHKTVFTKLNIGIIGGSIVVVTTILANLTSIIDFVEKHMSH